MDYAIASERSIEIGKRIDSLKLNLSRAERAGSFREAEMYAAQIRDLRRAQDRIREEVEIAAKNGTLR